MNKTRSSPKTDTINRQQKPHKNPRAKNMITQWKNSMIFSKADSTIKKKELVTQREGTSNYLDRGTK